MTRPMIFDTDGTGFYKRAIRQMMDQEEIPYLSGLGGSTGLGDEIMLLSGVDDLGAMYPHGFDDGPARTYTLPSPDRSTNYDFPDGAVELGMNGMRLGQPLADLSAGWPKSTRHHAYHYTGLGKADYHYTGLGAGWPEQKKPSYRYTGLGAGWPEQKKPSYRYTGLGATDADRVAAQAAYVACRAACAIAGPACQAACDATYAAAQAAMQSPGCDAACMRAKIDNIASAPVAHGVPSGSSGSTRTGSSSSSDTSADTGAPPAEDNTMLYVGGAALLAVIGYAVWSEMKDRKQYGR